MADKPVPKTCCDMRRKMVIFLGPYLSEQECGVPDSMLADFMRFDLTAPPLPNGKSRAVIGFKFCCWCGKRFEQASEVRISDVAPPPDEESGEAWKGGV
jgi:hypothetical protein